MRNLGKRKKTLHEMAFDCNLGNGIHKNWARNVGFFTMKKMGDVSWDFPEKGAGMQEFRPRQPPRQKGYNCNIKLCKHKLIFT